MSRASKRAVLTAGLMVRIRFPPAGSRANQWFPGGWAVGMLPLGARQLKRPAPAMGSPPDNAAEPGIAGGDGQSRAIGRSGIVGSVLAGDTRRVLGQIVGDREPRHLVDNKRVRLGAGAGIIIERRQRDAIERHGATVGLRAARVFVEFHQHGRAAHFTESAMRTRVDS